MLNTSSATAFEYYDIKNKVCATKEIYQTDVIFFTDRSVSEGD